MTKRQKIELEQSEKREAVNELLGKDSLTDEERAKLTEHTKRLQELEGELRAAIVAEPDAEETRAETLDAEQRERIELRSRASLGSYLLAAAQNRMVAGAEHELAAAAGVNGYSAGAVGRAIHGTAGSAGRAPGRHARAWHRGRQPGTRSCTAVFANSIAPRLGCRDAQGGVWHLRKRHHHHVSDRRGQGQGRRLLTRRRGRHDSDHRDGQAGERPPGADAGGYRQPWGKPTLRVGA